MTSRIAWLVFVLRLVIGAVFLTAGVLKVGHPTPLAVTIADFALLPSVLIAPLAILLPYVEIGLGFYLIVGLFTRYVAAIAAIQLLIFAGAIASVVVRGIHTSCGCFGPADTSVASWVDVFRDLLLVAITLPIFFVGPGRFAVDARLDAQATKKPIQEGIHHDS